MPTIPFHKLVVGEKYALWRRSWGGSWLIQGQVLGTYVRCEEVGRAYDPDAVLYFTNEKNIEFAHEHQLGMDEYSLITEESS